jgi:hypothetical protein
LHMPTLATGQRAVKEKKRGGGNGVAATATALGNDE